MRNRIRPTVRRRREDRKAHDSDRPLVWGKTNQVVVSAFTLAIHRRVVSSDRTESTSRRRSVGKMLNLDRLGDIPRQKASCCHGAAITVAASCQSSGSHDAPARSS